VKRTVIGLALTVAACGKASTTPAPAVTTSTVVTTQSASASTSGTIMIRGVTSSESFVPGMSPQALKAFVAEVPPDEKGGECTLTRTRGNGALTATAFYPTRTASATQVTITFDSAGHVVRYSEVRGVPHIKPGLRIEQVDSAHHAIQAVMRSTSITFDYPVDRAFALNRGASKPTTAITSTVREMENLDNLQRPAARMERMRKLCGV
jgi:hypothetical protein